MSQQAGQQFTASLQRARAYLTARQNADGGWGYTGEQSFAEPTCYALLALAAASPADHTPGETQARALKWFETHRSQAGAVAFEDDRVTPDNWGTMLACFTLQRLNISPELDKHYQHYLLASRGNRISPQAAAPLKLNGELQAWSWATGTASWVEPNAYALLALKAAGLRAHERVRTGETFLLDRACYDGGWNYGNKEVLEVKLEPMPTNTCFALLALQDLRRDHPVIQQSLRYLDRELAARQSTLTLALGALCFDVYERPVNNLLSGLLTRQAADGSWRGNNHLTALAALALALAVEKNNVFRV